MSLLRIRTNIMGMTKGGNIRLYGLRMSTAFWVLVFGTLLLLSEYNRHDIVPLLITSVCVIGGGTLLVGAAERLKRRYAAGAKEAAGPPWRYGLLQGVKFLIVVVCIKAINGTLADASAWLWCAAAVWLSGGGTLLMGAVERWRRVQIEKERIHGN